MAEPTAYIDPVEARAFVGDLIATTDYYARAIERLEGNLHRLGDSWLDAQFAEFEQEIDQLKAGLITYIDQACAAKAHLEDLSERAETYQKRQIR